MCESLTARPPMITMVLWTLALLIIIISKLKEIEVVFSHVTCQSSLHFSIDVRIVHSVVMVLQTWNISAFRTHRIKPFISFHAILFRVRGMPPFHDPAWCPIPWPQNIYRTVSNLTTPMATISYGIVLDSYRDVKYCSFDVALYMWEASCSGRYRGRVCAQKWQ